MNLPAHPRPGVGIRQTKAVKQVDHVRVSLPRTIRLLLATLAILLISTAALVGGSLLMLSSETGSAWLAGQLRQRSEGAVNWTDLEGRLTGPLTLRGLTVEQPGLALTISHLSLDWEPTALLGRHLQVDQLRLEGVKVALDEAAASEPSPPLQPSTIPLPLSVSLAAITIDGLSVQQADEPLLVVDSLAMAAHLVGRDLAVDSLTIRMPRGGATLSGQLAVADAMPLSLAVEWDWLLPGNADPLPLAGTARVDGQLDWSSRLDLQLEYQLATRGLAALHPELPPELTAHGSLAGSQQAGALALSQLSLAFAEVPARVTGNVRLSELDRDSPVVDLQLEWQELQWPLQAEPLLVRSNSGRLAMTGGVDDYRLQVDAHLQGADIPPGRWQLSGRGSTESLQLETLSGAVMDGALSASGMIGWAPGPNWDLQLTGSGLDSTALVPDLPGTLALALHSRGRLDETGAAVASLHLQEISGTLLDYPVQLQGEADIAGTTVQLAGLTLRSGANTLQASGTIAADALALDWQLRAADPGLVLAGARGVLAGSGTLGGSLEAPLLSATLGSDQLRLDDIAAADLALDITAGIAAGDPLRLRLRAGAVIQDDTPLLDAARLDVDGTVTAHRMAFAASVGEQSVSARLAGGLVDTLDRWVGTLDDLVIAAPDLGNWQLAGQSMLELSATRASLGDACLVERDNAGRACIGGDWTDAGSSGIALQLAALPVQAWLPGVTSLAEGRLRVDLAADGVLDAAGELTLSPGTVTVPVDRGPRQLAHGGGRLTLRVDKQGLLGVVDLDAPQQGRLDARLKLPEMNRWPLTEQQPVEGSLLANFPDLSSIAAWVPDVASTRGSLTADLSLAGSLAKPRASGVLSVSDAAASIPLAGLYVHDVTLDVRSNPAQPDRLDIRGAGVSGEGRITVAGQADLAGPRIELAVTGDRFLVYDTPDVRALLTPDLTVTWQDRLLTLRGRLEVPEADVTPQLSLSPGSARDTAAEGDSGSIIAPSPDVVIINGPEQAAEALRLPVEIDSAVEIVLGPGVNVNAVGFISRLPGAVTITTLPGQRDAVPMAKGQFAIEDGTFRAFGQDLDIESGQIIFPDGPVTQPEVNLRAVRWIDNNPEVTAVGVIVTGPVNAPTLTPFSRPPLEQSEIMSYLLTGRSSSGESGVLSIGTYVTPRFYVGYGYNLLESTNEFNSLFSITPRYGVSANVGEADNNVNVTVTYEH